MQNNTLIDLHKKLLVNLAAFDEFCKKQNIKYFLGYGTLIGALRHQDFVPWDDDVDVCMDRKNYEAFLKVAHLVPKPFSVHDAGIKTNDNFFAKWEDTSTTIIEKYSEKSKWARGIFIDIFPMDKIPNKNLKFKFFKHRLFSFFLYIIFKKISFKSFSWWLTLLVFPGYWLIKLIITMLPINKNKWRKVMNKHFIKWNNLNQNYRYACLVDPIEFPKTTFSKEIIESQLMNYQFNNLELPILTKSLLFLINKYGKNVMTIPKELNFYNQHLIIFYPNSSYLSIINNKYELKKLKKEIKLSQERDL